jgi:uncharacterized protein with NAD-binding domain and iron-sulfur cluster
MAKKVIILGGGVAGMSVAHELIERGYEVHVYERNPIYVGGKARSINYHGNPQHPYTNPLPGEHGFRFFPGFYKHIIDTMSRTPFPAANGKANVAQNLVGTTRIMMARYGKAPIVTLASFPKNLSDIELIIKDLHGVDSGLTADEIKFFSERVWQLCTSCKRRRNQDYERIGWWQYLEADRFPGKDGKPSAYQTLLVEGLTRTLVAAQAKSASTKTGGNVFLQLVFGMLDPTQPVDRVLNGPTNDAWLYAWHTYLVSRGVQYHQGAIAKQLYYDASPKCPKVTGADIESVNGGKIEKVSADHFVLATPVEQATKLITPAMISTDATLAYVQTLANSVSWMNGIQFYLNVDVPISKGHVIYSDSEWAITSISQTQFWNNYDISTKGNGKVRGVLSVDISDWFKPGKFTTTKCASDCSRKEVADEVWAQLKNSLNVDGQTILSDNMLEDWYLDRDITEHDKTIADTKALESMLQDSWTTLHNQIHNSSDSLLSKEQFVTQFAQQDIQRVQAAYNEQVNTLYNREPLLVNTVNSWPLRPEASCAITNLFFASDYVRTFTDLATMEGANEAARRAVNCLLDADNSSQAKCKVWPLKEPMMFLPLKWYDNYRWTRGLPWRKEVPLLLRVFMVPWSFLSVGVMFLTWIWKKIKSIFIK